MTTSEDFITAICREPERDDVRLVFADFLEENGDGERAEFIRVQIELAAIGHEPKLIEATVRAGKDGSLRMWPEYKDESQALNLAVGDRVTIKAWLPVGRSEDVLHNLLVVDGEHVRDYSWGIVRDGKSGVYPTERAIALRRRERELLDAMGANPFAFARDRITTVGLDDGKPHGRLPHGILRRGFVDHVAVTLADWFGTDCHDCDGAGQKQRYLGHGDQDVIDCPHCHGTGRIAGIGPRVVRCQPVTRVTLTDRRPAQWQTASEGEEQWTWAEENAIGDGDYPARLPRDLFALLRAPVSSAGDTVRYGSEADAHADLSAAALRWARAEADRREGVTV